MYDNTVRVANEALLDTYAISGGSTTGDALYLGGTQGGVEAQLVVDTALQFDDLTVILEHSDDGSSWSTLATLYDNTGNADATESTGILERYTLPQDCKSYVRADVVVAAGDSGEISVHPAYVAR